MSGGICKRKGFERGPWYEIKCVRDIIIAKEVNGENTSFERKLLKSWSKYGGYADAGKPISHS